MAYVAYSREQKAEAVALSRVVGVEQAAGQLGIDARAISRWLAAAGLSAGGSELDTDELARFERLAYAKLEGDLVSGKITGQRLATTWGIVRDKLDRRAREPKPMPSDVNPVAAWVDAIEADFPALRPDLVASHQGNAVAAFIDVLQAYLDVLGDLTYDAEVDFESFIRTFDPDAHAVEQARAKAEKAAHVAELTRQSWLKWNGTEPGGRRPPDPYADDPDVAALLAEADAYLQQNA